MIKLKPEGGNAFEIFPINSAPDMLSSASAPGFKVFWAFNLLQKIIYLYCPAAAHSLHKVYPSVWILGLSGILPIGQPQQSTLRWGPWAALPLAAGELLSTHGSCRSRFQPSCKDGTRCCCLGQWGAEEAAWSTAAGSWDKLAAE